MPICEIWGHFVCVYFINRIYIRSKVVYIKTLTTSVSYEPILEMFSYCTVNKNAVSVYI